jgi:hypothetical protein
MNSWYICWFFTLVLLGILIVKGLTARHLCKSLVVKGLTTAALTLHHCQMCHLKDFGADFR